MREKIAGGRRRRGQGAARRVARGDEAAAPAYVKRRIPFFAFAEEEGLTKLEDQAD